MAAPITDAEREHLAALIRYGHARLIRAASGMTQAGFARFAGISTRTVGRCESGDETAPRDPVAAGAYYAALRRLHDSNGPVTVAKAGPCERVYAHPGAGVPWQPATLPYRKYRLNPRPGRRASRALLAFDVRCLRARGAARA